MSDREVRMVLEEIGIFLVDDKSDQARLVVQPASSRVCGLCGCASCPGRSDRFQCVYELQNADGNDPESAHTSAVSRSMSRIASNISLLAL